MSKLFWITGLAGAGKSTAAKYLVQKLKEKYENVVMIDGDSVREICDNDLGYDFDDRKKNAFRIVKLCEYLCNQEMIVVCSTISLYREIHEYIYEHFQNPLIVYLDIAKETIISRNQKSLYTKSQNVIGKDMNYDVPVNVAFVKKITDTDAVFSLLDEEVRKI